MLGHDVNPSSVGNHVNPSPSLVPESPKESKKSKKKRKNKNKPNKWADKCMYAELLEMVADDPWSSSMDTPNDGLPSDLENGWVAVGPVPVGKRCLAVTHQSSGIAGNGTLLHVIFYSLIDSHLASTEYHLTISSSRESPHSTVSICASSAHNS
jgi:snurportin-1